MQKLKYRGNPEDNRIRMMEDVPIIQSILRNRGYLVQFLDAAAAWAAISRQKWNKENAWAAIGVWDFDVSAKLMLEHLEHDDTPYVEEVIRRPATIRRSINEPKVVEQPTIVGTIAGKPIVKIVSSTGRRGRPVVLGRFTSKEERDTAVRAMKGRDVKDIARELDNMTIKGKKMPPTAYRYGKYQWLDGDWIVYFRGRRMNDAEQKWISDNTQWCRMESRWTGHIVVGSEEDALIVYLKYS